MSLKSEWQYYKLQFRFWYERGWAGKIELWLRRKLRKPRHIIFIFTHCPGHGREIGDMILNPRTNVRSIVFETSPDGFRARAEGYCFDFMWHDGSYHMDDYLMVGTAFPEGEK